MKILLFLALILIVIQSSKHNTGGILQPRTEAPFWTGNAVLPNGEFKSISADDYRGKYYVLLFYPFDFTYVCPTEIIAFSDSQAKFDAINAKVISISIDSVFTHLAWTKTPRNQGGLGNMQIPLLADVSKDISRNFGVLVENPKDDLYGADLRGLYIIDGKGVIRSVTVNDAPGNNLFKENQNQKFKVGRSVDETLRLIQAFQYTDKHGEVCPEGWKPGSKTIIPDQEQKTKYFKEINKEL